MARIFISYRREDSAASAGRLHDRLQAHFGRDTIFIDIDTIEPGVDFAEVIERTVASCDVLIALIGRQWLTSTDAAGQRRLDNPEDFVRLEIATALARNIRVIPALVQNTSMPRAADLPDDLQPLARRNAVELSDTYFNRDVDRLMVVLDRVLEVTPSPLSPEGPPRVQSSYLRSWRFWGLAGLIIAGITVIAALSVMSWGKRSTTELVSPPSLTQDQPSRPSDTSPPLPPKPPVQPRIEEQEPNNDIGSAAFIIEGTTIRGSLATPQDRDTFAFSVSSPKTRVILRKQFDAAVDIYDSVEQIVASYREVGDKTISHSFESTPGSSYYVVVKAYAHLMPPAGSRQSGDYQLVVRQE